MYPVIIEEINEVVRLIPQERIKQRTVEQTVVVPRTSSRERYGGSGPDHSPETELLMYQWRYNAKDEQSRQFKKQWWFYKYSSLIEW